MGKTKLWFAFEVKIFWSQDGGDIWKEKESSNYQFK